MSRRIKLIFQSILSRILWATRVRSALVATAALASLGGCAVLHHVQLSDIDARGKHDPFEIKVSETGVNLQEAVQLQRALLKNNRVANAGGDVAAFVSLFQQGPRTGNPVYTSTYAEKLVTLLHESCPTGKITSLESIRETRKYPVISGEIVKIKGDCITDRKPASIENPQLDRDWIDEGEGT